MFRAACLFGPSSFHKANAELKSKSLTMVHIWQTADDVSLALICCWECTGPKYFCVISQRNSRLEWHSKSCSWKNICNIYRIYTWSSTESSMVRFCHLWKQENLLSSAQYAAFWTADINALCSRRSFVVVPLLVARHNLILEMFFSSKSVYNV